MSRFYAGVQTRAFSGLRQPFCPDALLTGGPAAPTDNSSVRACMATNEQWLEDGECAGRSELAFAGCVVQCLVQRFGRPLLQPGFAVSEDAAGVCRSGIQSSV